MSENLQQVIEEMDTKMAELDALLSSDEHENESEPIIETKTTEARNDYGRVVRPDGEVLVIVPAA